MREYIWGETYELTEELEGIMAIMKVAMDYNDLHKEYLVPHSFWMDNLGWLYIKWAVQDSIHLPVVRYQLDVDGELVIEKIVQKLRAVERLRGNEPDKPVVLITGDTHRDFKRIIQFCERYETTKDDVMIILGDAGINFCNDKSDGYVKDRLAQLPLTLFCIHGNHEMRPQNIKTYHTERWHGGEVYVESKYPNLIFAKDGEIYDIAGKKTIVIGGAYSVDKWYRLRYGMEWFEDEQPSEETKKYVEEQLAKNQWKVDVVLSHTTPYQYRPIDLFLQSIDQSTVDDSTERWLRSLEENLTYEKWYAGHYHCDRTVDQVQLMFRRVEIFCGERDLAFEMT